MGKTAIIILAAGNSSRLGSPKQLLQFHGKTLIARLVEQARLATPAVLVVTGSQSDEIVAEVQDDQVIPINNVHWESGMGSSIRIGTQNALERFSDLEQVILAVCDQPFVTASVFSALLAKAALSPQNIVACSYSETVGTPVLFKQKYFPHLVQFDGHFGAKKLIEEHSQDLVMVPFPQGEIDLDTIDDYESLIRKL